MKKPTSSQGKGIATIIIVIAFLFVIGIPRKIWSVISPSLKPAQTEASSETQQSSSNQSQTTYSLGVGLSFGITRDNQVPNPREYPLGSKENPIHIERIVINYSGVVSLQPSDSIWFSIDQQHVGQYGYQIKFSSPEGKLDFWRIGDKKQISETPDKRFSSRELVGVTLFCLHNTGSGTVILYAWYGYKSSQDIQALAGR